MNDGDIRKVLRDSLSRRYSDDSNTIIIEELGLNNGSSRVDIAVVNGMIHGIEIKSDKDSLERLPEQVRIYNSVLDRITLVVGYRLAGMAIKMIPEWWGVKLAEQSSNGKVRLNEARSPKNNPQQNKLSVVKLLWRKEALELLEEMTSVNGMRSKPRKVIYSKIAEIADLDTILSRVRYQLRNRRDWRVAEQQK